MSTYTQIIYQIVFGTKNREHTLTAHNRHELYKYMNGLLERKNCLVYRINGVEDHVHIVTHIHPSISLASLVKDLKVSSAIYIKEKQLFKNFNGWQNGYGAFTYTINELDRLIEYVKNQEEHHSKKKFVDEYKDLLNKHGVNFDERYLP